MLGRKLKTKARFRIPAYLRLPVAELIDNARMIRRHWVSAMLVWITVFVFVVLLPLVTLFVDRLLSSNEWDLARASDWLVVWRVFQILMLLIAWIGLSMLVGLIWFSAGILAWHCLTIVTTTVYRLHVPESEEFLRGYTKAQNTIRKKYKKRIWRNVWIGILFLGLWIDVFNIDFATPLESIKKLLPEITVFLISVYAYIYYLEFKVVGSKQGLNQQVAFRRPTLGYYLFSGYSLRRVRKGLFDVVLMIALLVFFFAPALVRGIALPGTVFVRILNDDLGHRSQWPEIDSTMKAHGIDGLETTLSPDSLADFFSARSILGVAKSDEYKPFFVTLFTYFALLIVCMSIVPIVTVRFLQNRWRGFIKLLVIAAESVVLSFALDWFVAQAFYVDMRNSLGSYFLFLLSFSLLGSSKDAGFKARRRLAN